jgi:hypothetical protein
MGIFLFFIALSPMLGITGNRDGALSGSKFMNPLGLALDYFHRIIVVGDSYNIPLGTKKQNGKTYRTTVFKYSLRMISLKNSTVMTLAGGSSK